MKQIAVALSIAVLLTAAAAFGLHGWTALTISQQSVTVECESGAACESSQQRPRNGRVGLDSEY